MSDYLNFDKIDNISFSDCDDNLVQVIECYKCNGRIDVQDTYSRLSQFFKDLSKVYKEKAKKSLFRNAIETLLNNIL